MLFGDRNWPKPLRPQKYIYHNHYEGEPCETCGYAVNTGYFFDEIGFHIHLQHTIKNTDMIIDRLLKDKPNERGIDASKLHGGKI
jgi:hypothetical protein